MEGEDPMRFSIAAAGTIKDVDPRGKDRIARRWFSY